MKMIKKATLATMILATSALSQAETLEFSSGSLGGGWYTMAAGIGNLAQQEDPNLSLKVVPGGGTANPSKVNNGRSQLGWSLDSITNQASTGTVLYEGKPHEDLMMIGMSFSDLYTHFIRAEDAPYKTIDEIFTKGKDVKIGITKAGSSDEQVFRWLMDSYGTSYDDLRDNRGFKVNHASYAELASQFKDGQIDYVFVNLGVPGSTIIEMAQARNLDIMDFPSDLQTKLHDDYGLVSGEIAGNSYEGVSDTATTIKLATTLLISKQVSEESAYTITKALCEHQSELPSIHASMSVFDCATAADNAPAPIHPGAVKYFTEKGYM